jgi:hypothetical protein
VSLHWHSGKHPARKRPKESRDKFDTHDAAELEGNVRDDTTKNSSEPG